MKEYYVISRFLAKTKQLLKNNNSKENIARSIEAANTRETAKPTVEPVIERTPPSSIRNQSNENSDPTDPRTEIEPRSAINFAHKSALNARLDNSNPNELPDLANKRAMDEHLQDLKYHSNRSDAKGMLEKINNHHGRVDNLRNELYGHLDQSLSSLKRIHPNDHKHLYDKYIQPIHAKIGELSKQKLNALREAYDSIPDGDHKDSVLKSVLQEIKHQKDAWSNKSDFLRSSSGKDLFDKVNAKFNHQFADIDTQKSNLERQLKTNRAAQAQITKEANRRQKLGLDPSNNDKKQLANLKAKENDLNNAMQSAIFQRDNLEKLKFSEQTAAQQHVNSRRHDWDTELQNHNNAAKNLPQPSPRELRHYKSVADRDAERVRSTWGDVSSNANEDQRKLSEADAIAGSAFGRDDSRTGYRTDAEGIKPVLNRETGEYEMVPVQPQTGALASRIGRTVIAPTDAELAEQSKRKTNTENLEAAKLASIERDLSAGQDKNSPRNIETGQNKKVAQDEREMQRLNLNRTLEGLRDEHAKLIKQKEKAFSTLVAKYGDEPLSDEEQREFLIDHKLINDEHSPAINKKAQEIANQERAIKLHENLTNKLNKSLKAKFKSASKDNKKIKIDLIKRFIKETALNKNNKSYSAVQYNIFKLLELKNQLSKSIGSDPHLDKLNSLNREKSEISNNLKNSIKNSPTYRTLTAQLAQVNKNIEDHMKIPKDKYNAENAPVGSGVPKPTTLPKSTEPKSTEPKSTEPKSTKEDGTNNEHSNSEDDSWIDTSKLPPKSKYEPEVDYSEPKPEEDISDAAESDNNDKNEEKDSYDPYDYDVGAGKDDNETTRRTPDESSREYGSQDFELKQPEDFEDFDEEEGDKNKDKNKDKDDKDDEDKENKINLFAMLPDEERHRPMSQTYEPRMSRERAVRGSYDKASNTDSDNEQDYMDFIRGRRSNKNKIS